MPVIHHLENVFFGQMEIDSTSLRTLLERRSCNLIYHDELQSLHLYVEGRAIFRLTCPYESAVKLAADLGLPASNQRAIKPTDWSVIIDRIILHHDGSEEADMLHARLMKLNAPHTVTRKAQKVGLVFGGSVHLLPMFTLEQLFAMIEEFAIKKAA